ncbi:MAG: carboxyl transferase domain-containing protein [Burkholderiales bacterium]
MTFAELPLSEQFDAWLGHGTHAPFESRAAGDVVVQRATVAGRALLVVAFDYGRQHGSIGPAEAQQIGEALHAAVGERRPLVFLMNTSGMRVTAGMATVAALRTLLRSALDAKLAGQPLFAVVSRYAFGGASMLASLCDRRTMQPGSQLAMSGPKLIERIAGHAAFNASDRAAVRALIGGEARAAVTDTTLLCEDSPAAYHAALSAWLATLDARSMEVDWMEQRTAALHKRLGARVLPPPASVDLDALDGTTRRALALLRPGVTDVRCAGSAILARTGDGNETMVCGLVGGTPATAPSTFALTEALLHWAGPRSGLGITLLADVENHSADPADERVVLSEYLAHLALVLRLLHRRGNDVHVIVTGISGGGIFAALSAGASRVSMLRDARIQVLSPAALAALDKAADREDETLSAALSAGAVDSAFPAKSPA